VHSAAICTWIMTLFLITDELQALRNIFLNFPNLWQRYPSHFISSSAWQNLCVHLELENEITLHNEPICATLHGKCYRGHVVRSHVISSTYEIGEFLGHVIVSYSLIVHAPTRTSTRCFPRINSCFQLVSFLNQKEFALTMLSSWWVLIWYR
jgi:hypothetical protein